MFTFFRNYDRLLGALEKVCRRCENTILTRSTFALPAFLIERTIQLVYVTGDLHGDITRFEDPGFRKLRPGDYLLVCGDFGFIWDGSRTERANLRRLSRLPYTIAFVDGCHENFDLLEKNFRIVRWRGGRAHLISPNIFHMMRGEIFTIENHTFFSFGGGHSQDFEYREHQNWWPRERPNRREIDHAIHNLNLYHAKVDYIITHEPPASLKDCLGVDMQQRLEIHTFFEDIIKQCTYQKWFFGKCHMDRFIPMKFYAVFEEVLPVEPARRRRSSPPGEMQVL